MIQLIALILDKRWEEGIWSCMTACMSWCSMYSTCCLPRQEETFAPVCIFYVNHLRSVYPLPKRHFTFASNVVSEYFVLPMLMGFSRPSTKRSSSISSPFCYFTVTFSAFFRYFPVTWAQFWCRSTWKQWSLIPKTPIGGMEASLWPLRSTVK